MEEKIIVIGGGVGPLAGVKLHEHVINNTLTDGTDQDHLEVYHLSRSQDIMDRTEAILSGVPRIPAEGMLNTMRIADAALKSAGRTGIAGIPCNTFHSPDIFAPFTEMINREDFSLKVLSMIDETVSMIKQKYNGIRRIGLMSTTGTRKTEVYRKIMEPAGFTIVEVSGESQPLLHESIYNRQWGLKSAAGITEKARTNFLTLLEELIDKDVQAVILGCTEIPLALPEKEVKGIPLIDPMVALARALIREADPLKLKPME